MQVEPNAYDKQVIESILATNRFGIREVNNLESLKSIYFVEEEYKDIEKFIKAGDLAGIKAFHENQQNTGEYLDIMVFTDQNKKTYSVTIYDSNTLEQDPQVIEIYSL